MRKYGTGEPILNEENDIQKTATTEQERERLRAEVAQEAKQADQEVEE